MATRALTDNGLKPVARLGASGVPPRVLAEPVRIFSRTCEGARAEKAAREPVVGHIRTTMGALALIGAPPEKYWGYGAERLDEAPPAFCYSYAQNYQALAYYRLDSKPSRSAAIFSAAPEKGGGKETVLASIRETLASGLVPMFGFHVFESIRQAGDGKIPYPGKGEREIGGHAVLAVGYDNEMEIGECKGAFLIRNSWGESWGEKGYGWLPYDYVLKGLAEDWWVLVKAEWVDEGQFGV